jgi:hypothetical protein
VSAIAQREKPGITPEQLNVTFGRPADTPGTLVSGGQIENFREGWALHILSSSKKAHWYVRDRFDEAVSLCKVSAPVRWLYGRGNWPTCKRCMALRNRMNSEAIVRR